MYFPCGLSFESEEMEEEEREKERERGKREGNSVIHFHQLLLFDSVCVSRVSLRLSWYAECRLECSGSREEGD